MLGPVGLRMVQSLYEEIVVRGEEFVSVRLTPEAYAHGLALALPEEVVVPALPDLGRSTARIKYGVGAPDRIRTCDLRLRRPTLYPLSYRRGSRSYRLVPVYTFGFLFDALSSRSSTLGGVATTLVERSRAGAFRASPSRPVARASRHRS